MTIDLNPRNIKNEKIKLWKHQLKFINPHKKYADPNIPSRIQDWFDLFRKSISEKQNITLNLTNRGVAKTAEIINSDNISPEDLRAIKIAEGTKKVLAIEYNEGIKEERERNEKIIKELELKNYILELSYKNKKDIDDISNITGKNKIYIKKIIE